MTPQDALHELAIAMNHTAYDEQSSGLYLREIAGYDSRDVEAACKHIARTAQWWPKMSELISAIHEQGAIRKRLTRGADDPERTFRCLKCQDSGWLCLDCSGPPQRECGRSDRPRSYPAADGKRLILEGACETPHTYAVHCLCGRR